MDSRPVQEKKSKDPTIRGKFNTYRFADYKEKVIDLLTRVTTVSVRTVAIIESMKESSSLNAHGTGGVGVGGPYLL
jgi:hypothetical protein